MASPIRNLAVLVACASLGCPSPGQRPVAPAPVSARSEVTPRDLDGAGGLGILDTYQRRVLCFAAPSCHGVHVNVVSATAVERSSTATASLEALALISADRAARILAPKVLEAAGRPRDAQRLAALPRLTTVGDARAAMKILDSFVDQDAAFRAWWYGRPAEDWSGELGGNSQWRTPRAPSPSASKAELFALSLHTLSRALDLYPEPCNLSVEIECETPTHEDSLANAIVATIDALEIATRAGLERSDAEKLAIDTFTELMAAARASRP